MVKNINKALYWIKDAEGSIGLGARTADGKWLSFVFTDGGDVIATPVQGVKRFAKLEEPGLYSKKWRRFFR